MYSVMYALLYTWRLGHCFIANAAERQEVRGKRAEKQQASNLVATFMRGITGVACRVLYNRASKSTLFVINILGLCGNSGSSAALVVLVINKASS